ncbi:UNVERIFIED_CONTAM: hypothetical protein RMT77_009187 [Armadillidium vulgare]
MALVNPSYEECSFGFCDMDPNRIYCQDNILLYPGIPVAQTTELESYPTVMYTVYPTVDMNDCDLNFVKPFESSVSSLVDAERVECGEVGIFYTSSPERRPSDESGKNYFHNFDESLSLSECSPKDGTEEKSLLSSALSSSFENDNEHFKVIDDSGYYDKNGCWYPTSNANSSAFSKSESDSTQIEFQSSEDSSKVPAILPPSRLMMPKPLMSYYNYYQRLDLPSAALGRPHLVHTFSTGGNISVEDLWLAHMKLLFRNFPHKWTLSAAHSSAQFDQTYNSFKDLAKVRFYCQNCLDGWTSMFGVVVFFYSWNKEKSCGQIWYQVSGQKCGKCNPDTFEMPLWYPEEAQKVITNLYYEIASRFYGLRTPQHIRTRRLGQPINQHNRSLCEGCTHGLCKQDGSKNNLPSCDPQRSSFKQSLYGLSDVTCYSNVNPDFASLPYNLPTGGTPYFPSHSTTFPISSSIPYSPAIHPAPPPYLPNSASYFDPMYQCPPINYDVSYYPNYVPQMTLCYPLLNY